MGTVREAQLRCGSGAVQTLGYNDTTHPDWWGDNFSFVPPLWNTYPARGHRDMPGAHHLGEGLEEVEVEDHPGRRQKSN